MEGNAIYNEFNGELSVPEDLLNTYGPSKDLPFMDSLRTYLGLMFAFFIVLSYLHSI